MSGIEFTVAEIHVRPDFDAGRVQINYDDRLDPADVQVIRDLWDDLGIEPWTDEAQ